MTKFRFPRSKPYFCEKAKDYTNAPKTNLSQALASRWIVASMDDEAWGMVSSISAALR